MLLHHELLHLHVCSGLPGYLLLSMGKLSVLFKQKLFKLSNTGLKGFISEVATEMPCFIQPFLALL